MRRLVVRRRRNVLVCTFTTAIIAAAVAPAHQQQVVQEEELRLPSLLDADDVAWFFEGRDLDGLYSALQQVFYRSARTPDPMALLGGGEAPDSSPQPLLPEQLVSRGGGSTYTTAYKLKHDLEQAEYLAEILRDKEEAEFFRSVVAPTYRKILERIPPLETLERTQGLYPFSRTDKETTQIEALYNKAWHQTSIEDVTDESGEPLPLINPNLDPDPVERQWFGEEDYTAADDANKHPGIVVVDDLLSPETLEALQKIMWESTVWYQTKLPKKFGGYIGAYIDDGLHDYILLQLALDLADKFPRIFAGHPLRYLWTYKYDSDFTGINLHADQAAVNVNIWLTPDEANLDPNSGGLVVFTAKPSADWDFASYNTNTDFVRERLLQPTGFANVTIPYRCNRAVIFDSALFHQTDEFRFKPGYKNRRINLTLLYGTMQMAEPAPDDEL